MVGSPRPAMGEPSEDEGAVFPGHRGPRSRRAGAWLRLPLRLPDSELPLTGCQVSSATGH